MELFKKSLWGQTKFVSLPKIIANNWNQYDGVIKITQDVL